MTDLPAPAWADLPAATRRKVSWGPDGPTTPPNFPTPTLPKEPTVADTDEGLGDLFVPAEPESAEQPLSDLFADPPPAEELSELFGPDGTESAEQPLSDLFADPPPAEELSELFPPVAAPAAPEPPAPKFADTRLAQRRAQVDAARAAAPAMPAPVMSDAVRALADSPRYRRSEELAPLVDQILALGAGDDPLSRYVRRMELTRDHTVDARQVQEYRQHLRPRMLTAGIQPSSAAEFDLLTDMAYDEILGIGPLGPLWRDDAVTEILVSGPDKVTVERNGRLETTPVRFRDLRHLEETARRIGRTSGDDRAVSSTNPLVTIQLPGARVQFVWRPLAVAKVAIAIRKFGALMDMAQLMSFGSLDEPIREFLQAAVQSRATVLVSGGTASGKTTFINALSEFIPDTERVVTIEDALELQLRNTHVEAFVTKEAASADDHVLFGQDQLLKASLRMRPDRVIVGEIRDGAGCAVMLEAANTGHSGTMTTIHANTPELAVKRMTNLLRRVDAMPDDVAREEVVSAIDVIVQVVRTRGRRFVSDVAVVAQDGQVRTLFEGRFPPGAESPQFRQVGRLGPDTDVAARMSGEGIDPAKWGEGTS